MISKKAMGISPSPTLSIDSKFKEMKANGEDVVGFGAGEPDFDTPQHIKDAAIAAINAGKTKYTPAAGTLALRKAVADKFKRENGLDYKPSNIVVSNGAKHSLVNTFMAILNPGDEVIIPALLGELSGDGETCGRRAGFNPDYRRRWIQGNCR